MPNNTPKNNPTKKALKPPLLVAEISANHNQNLSLALQTIQSAKNAGADFVKIQTYTPDSLTIDSSASYFRINSGTKWDGETLYELYKKAYTPFEWHKELFAHARALGVGIFSSPFCARGVELLEGLDCPMYKIASFEITDIALISLVASTKKPIIISTGIATHALILDALDACYKAGNSDITLLHCVSEYPASLESAHILEMPNLAKYGTKYGLSDHTIGSGKKGESSQNPPNNDNANQKSNAVFDECADLCAILAASLGASIIEKHFIISRNLGGVDSHFSMEEAEFATMAKRVRAVPVAMGKNNALDFIDLLKSTKHFSGDFTQKQKNATQNLAQNLSHDFRQDFKQDFAQDFARDFAQDSKPKSPFARSLFVCENIKKGENLSTKNIRSIRPSNGLLPKYLPQILGRKAVRNLKRGEPLKIGDFEGDL
ncbi:N-acetylneuraminate synthase family protein [Helicobacter sp. T3_23-1056]